jgi:phage repressor protein C with HTH and peptisase S24 domain
MEPTLRDGDWLLVDPAAHVSHAGRALHPGDVVVARDPRAADRVIVKRVESVAAWPDTRVVLASDNPAHAGERIEATFDDVTGGPWFRYWPPTRIGRVR